MRTEIKIGGIPYKIKTVKGELDVCHDGSGQKLWGQISYLQHSIRVLKTSPERELRLVLHEVLHGIINEYNIRELMNDEGEHKESPIDQLALGIAEVLESIGINDLKPKKIS
jgi:hypothetical protein